MRNMVLSFVPVLARQSSASQHTDRTKTTSPLSLPLFAAPDARAIAFPISPDVAVTALHTIRKARHIRVAHSDASVYKADPYTDLVLLRLKSALKLFRSVSFCTEPIVGKHYIVHSTSATRAHASLTFRGIEFETLLTVGSRIPLLVFHDETNVIGPGWSGAAVYTPTSLAVIGVVTQVMNNGVVHAIPARFLQRLRESDNIAPLSYLPWLSTQPLVSNAARVAAKVAASDGIRVARSLRNKLQVNDILTSINGKRISPSGLVDWHGAQATWQAAVCETLPEESVPVEFMRAGGKMTDSVVVRDARYAVGAVPWMTAEVAVAGPVVFAALSFELLVSWEWMSDAPKDLVDVAFAECAEGQEEVVVLVGCAEEEEEQWKEFRYLRVVRVNEGVVKGLMDLVGDGDEGNLGRMMTVEFANGFVVAVPQGKLQQLDFARQL